MDYLGEGEVLTNTDLNKFVNKIWEKYNYCIRRNSLKFLIWTSEKWERKQTCCVYIFVQCIYSRVMNELSPQELQYLKEMPDLC